VKRAKILFKKDKKVNNSRTESQVISVTGDSPRVLGLISADFILRSVVYEAALLWVSS
jgi:hypothetical protein